MTLVRVGVAADELPIVFRESSDKSERVAAVDDALSRPQRGFYGKKEKDRTADRSMMEVPESAYGQLDQRESAGSDYGTDVASSDTDASYETTPTGTYGPV